MIISHYTGIWLFISMQLLVRGCLLKAVKAELHSLNSSNKKNKSVYSPVDLPSLKHQTLPTRKETFGYKQLTFLGEKLSEPKLRS